jgi:hypothetical protein
MGTQEKFRFSNPWRWVLCVYSNTDNLDVCPYNKLTNSPVPVITSPIT